jgi:hypothetical protein
VKNGSAWVGDQVFDEDAEREGIITDVSSGVYVLRPVAGGGPEWTNSERDRLRVTVPLVQS